MSLDLSISYGSISDEMAATIREALNKFTAPISPEAILRACEAFARRKGLQWKGPPPRFGEITGRANKFRRTLGPKAPTFGFDPYNPEDPNGVNIGPEQRPHDFPPLEPRPRPIPRSYEDWHLPQDISTRGPKRGRQAPPGPGAPPSPGGVTIAGGWNGVSSPFFSTTASGSSVNPSSSLGFSPYPPPPNRNKSPFDDLIPGPYGPPTPFEMWMRGRWPPDPRTGGGRRGGPPSPSPAPNQPPGLLFDPGYMNAPPQQFQQDQNLPPYGPDPTYQEGPKGGPNPGNGALTS
jgi:hypothetical protein